MTRQFDVTGPGKWELAIVDTKVATEGFSRYTRRTGPLIDPFDIPLVFSSHVLAIGATNFDLPGTWFNCANIVQLAIGATVEDSGIWSDTYDGTEPIVVSRKMLRLNQTLELFIFDPVSAELRLGFEPMPWVPKFSYGIYEFKGAVEDTTEDLIQAARAQLVSIESKLDNLQQP